MKLATSRNVKKNIIQLYKGFVTEYLFNEEYAQFVNDEGQAFRMYINEIEDCIRCNPAYKEELIDCIIDIHDRYLEHCALHRLCEGCPYKSLFQYKGACFEPFVMDRIKINTPIDMIIKIVVVMGIVACVLGLITISCL